MFKIVCLCLCFFVYSCAPTQNKADKTNAINASSQMSWSADVLESSIVYMTKGATNSGNRFSLIKKKGNCSEDILSISWTTNIRSAQHLKGITADFEMNVDGVFFNLPIDLTEASKLSSSSVRLTFSNFIVNEKLISFLENGNLIQARIVAPEKLNRQLDNPADMFNLEDFEDIRAKANKMCKDL